jgi:hypothetical protein
MIIHATKAPSRTRQMKATAHAATRRQVAIANGIPITVMHIHFKTIPKLCHECTNPAHAAVGILDMLVLLKNEAIQYRTGVELEPCARNVKRGCSVLAIQ